MGEKEKNSICNEIVTKNTVILYTYKTNNGYNMNIFLCSSLGIQSFF